MSDFFLADDLSGALDAAAGFHHAGRRVTIALTPAAWQRAGVDEIVGFTTESRNAPPADAAARVTRAIAHGRGLGGRLVYKKIDSTLRGPVAAEIGALAAAMPEARILFAPANPLAGRTVRDGVLLVRGVPVAETEFGRDPISPVRESAIARLLGDAAAARVIVPDVTSEDDLETAVRQMDASGGDWVGVGSGALARPVAARGRPVGGKAVVAAAPLPAGPVLMVCGSAHERNREQGAAFERARAVRIDEFIPESPAAALAAGISAIRAHQAAVLVVAPRRGDSSLIVQRLATTVAEIVRATGTQRLFVTGGETAFAICQRMEVSLLHFRCEVEAGLSLSRGEPARGPALHLAIKPGGFGDAQTWIRAWDALRAS